MSGSHLWIPFGSGLKHLPDNAVIDMNGNIQLIIAVMTISFSSISFIYYISLSPTLKSNTCRRSDLLDFKNHLLLNDIFDLYLYSIRPLLQCTKGVVSDVIYAQPWWFNALRLLTCFNLQICAQLDFCQFHRHFKTTECLILSQFYQMTTCTYLTGYIHLGYIYWGLKLVAWKEKVNILELPDYVGVTHWLGKLTHIDSLTW